MPPFATTPNEALQYVRREFTLFKGGQWRDLGMRLMLAWE